MRQELAYSRDAAETLALDALGWIAAEDDLLQVMMGATGIGQDEIATRMSDGDFLASVLDFLLMDDAWIIGFCDARALPYSAPAHARESLPGGQQMHWT